MPPSGGQGQSPGQGQTENHMAPIWIIIAIFVFAYILWAFFKGPIVKAFLYIKLGEIGILDFFTSGLTTTQQEIHQILPQAAIVPFSQLALIATQVGHYLMIPTIFLLAVFSIVLYFRSSTANFRHTYDMKSLLQVESPLWPQVTPVIGKNLVKQHVEQGPWAMAMTPMQFAKHYKLLKENPPTVQENQLKKISRITVSVIREQAADVFVRQLGYLWRGPEHLNMHTKALFAAFAARANADPEAARELLFRIAASAGGKLDFTGTNELIAKYANTKIVKQAIAKHAYTMTVMASMLELARTDGVVASADFLWLKPVDRQLWFLLNTVGRQTAPAEVSGPFAHWLAERELGRKIRAPMVHEAVIGLEEAIKNVIYHPEEKVIKEDEK